MQTSWYMYLTEVQFQDLLNESKACIDESVVSS